MSACVENVPGGDWLIAWQLYLVNKSEGHFHTILSSLFTSPSGEIFFNATATNIGALPFPTVSLLLVTSAHARSVYLLHLPIVALRFPLIAVPSL